ncbi:MAG: alpha/beta hydrolase, partial [Alphaproteobacteria bacterium]
DKAYHNTGVVSNTADILNEWESAAPAFRRARRLLTENMSYGSGEREKLDLFLPELSPPKGLMFFIHGGYWLKFDKSYFSHFAEGALLRGYAVAMPSYDLKPQADMMTITSQMEQALMCAVEHVGGPVFISGHSAGGHLAAMLIREENQLSKMVKDRIRRVMGISGVYELGPLTNTTMNDEFKFSDVELQTQSPMRLNKMQDPEFVSWVGGDELNEFIRQSEYQAKVWESPYIPAAGKNHFTVIEDLRDPASSMLNTLFA